MAEIIAVNRYQMIAITDGGDVVEITNGFDTDDNDCTMNAAVYCIAGPDINGRWFSIDLAGFQPVTTN